MLRIFIPGLILFYHALAFAKPVSTIELQWMICEGSEQAFFEKSGVQAGKPQQRSVYYSETEDQELLMHGVVLRTRAAGKKIKTAAKIEFESEQAIPWGLLEGADSKCEWNGYAEDENLSCSLNSKSQSLQDLPAPEQREFITTATGFAHFEKLHLWGPVESSQWEWREPRLKMDLVLESTRIDSRFFVMELSTRTSVDKREEVSRRMLDWLQEKSLSLCPDQKSKTPAILGILIPRLARSAQ